MTGLGFSLTETASRVMVVVYDPSTVSCWIGWVPNRDVVGLNVAAVAPEYGSTTFTSRNPTAAVKANVQRLARERTWGRLTVTPTGLDGVSGTSSASRLPTITKP